MLAYAYARDVVIHVGELHAAVMPTTIRTLLGSCIAVCLYERAARVGGMNHFLLPDSDELGSEMGATRFGVHAMEELIFQMQNLGAERKRLVGKLFGGAHVLKTPDTTDSVPRRNVAFIEHFMAAEKIPVLSCDLGGESARQIVFETDRGVAYVKRLKPAADQLRQEAQQVAAARRKRRYGSVTLF